MEGVKKVMPITSADNKAQRRLEVKARSTLMMGIPDEHQLKFNSINIDNLSDAVILQSSKKSRQQEQGNLKRSVLVETSTSTALVSYDGLSGYDWSDQAKEGPNYERMAYSS
ncbi:hypothetical protein Tco_1231942 [Tanacetum coccineum]